MGSSGAILHSPGTETTWVEGSTEIPECSNQQTMDNSLRERIQSGLTASTRPPSQLHESAKLLGAGGIAGAFSKTCTAPLARLTILYQVWSSKRICTTTGCLLMQVTFSCRYDSVDKTISDRPEKEQYTHPSLERSRKEYTDFCSQTPPHRPVKTRNLQVQALKTVPSGIGQLSLGRAFSHVVRQEGLLALWKGNGVTVVHRIPYSAINFWAYERITELWRRHVPSEKSNPGLDCVRRLASGGLAGGLACAVVSHPLCFAQPSHI